MCLWEGTVVEVKHTLPYSVTGFLESISLILHLVRKLLVTMPIFFQLPNCLLDLVGNSHKESEHRALPGIKYLKKGRILINDYTNRIL